MNMELKALGGGVKSPACCLLVLPPLLAMPPARYWIAVKQPMLPASEDPIAPRPLENYFDVFMLSRGMYSSPSPPFIRPPPLLVVLRGYPSGVAVSVRLRQASV